MKPSAEVIPMNISELNFTKRTYENLMPEDSPDFRIETVFRLATSTRKSLLMRRGLGPVALREIEEKLSGIGLTLGMTHPDTAELISSARLQEANELIRKANELMKEAEVKRDELITRANDKKEAAKSVRRASEPLEKFLE